jgi:hypothetical protein
VLCEAVINAITAANPMVHATPAIAGARLALLFIASRIDQMATNTAIDKMTPTQPPRDPET